MAGPWDEYSSGGTAVAEDQGPWTEFEEKPDDLSKIKLSPYEQATVDRGGLKPPSGMESGTELTTALAGGAARATALVPPTIRTVADLPTTIARGVSMGQGHYADMPLVGEERAAQAEGFGAAMQKPFVPLDIFKMRDEEGDPAWATAIKEAERMLVSIPEFIESPLGVLTMGSGLGGKAATTGVRYAFAADMLKSLFEQAPQLRNNWAKMNPNQQAEAITQFLGTAAMTGLLTHPEARGTVKDPLRNVAEREAPLAPDPVRLTPGGRSVFGAEAKPLPVEPSLAAAGAALNPPSLLPPQSSEVGSPDMGGLLSGEAAMQPFRLRSEAPPDSAEVERAIQEVGRSARPALIREPPGPAAQVAARGPADLQPVAGEKPTKVQALEAEVAPAPPAAPPSPASIAKELGGEHKGTVSGRDTYEFSGETPDAPRALIAVPKGSPIEVVRQKLQAARNRFKEPAELAKELGQEPAKPETEVVPAPTGEAPPAVPVETNARAKPEEQKPQVEAGPKGLAGEVRRRLEAGDKPDAEAGGGVPIGDLIHEFGKSIYQKGMAFADWSARMVRELGEKARDWIELVWNRLTVSARDLARMTPEAITDWKKKALYGPEYMRKLAGEIRQDELPSLVAERDRLRQEISGTIKGWTKQPTEAQWRDYQLKQVKAQTLNEMVENAPKPAATYVPSVIEAGAGIPIPRVITDTLKKSRDTIKTLWKTRDVRDVMTYMKDVAGNTATVYGQRVGNNVRGQLRRAMARGKAPNVLDENALTFVREADGDRGQLAVMRGKIASSTAADPKWKTEALKAIDHAESNWDRINPIASQYERATDAQIAAENAAGINTLSRNGYVMHAQDVQNEFGFFAGTAGEGTTGFKHARAYDTFADSIAAGIDPKTLNGVVLLSQRVARGQMLINNRMWVESLRATIDPQTRKSVVTEPEIISRGPGLPPDVRAPTDYVTEIAGGRPIAILKSYSGIFRALTEPSKFSESLGWNMALKAATTGKHIALLLDTFHLGRIAFWESVIKPLSFTDPKLPLPSYKRGVLTLDYSPAELQRMANAGEIDPAALPEILTAQRDVNGLVKHGYNVAKISDQLHQEWLQKIPITGTFNKWLFNQFQRGAMAEIGAMEVPRYRRMHPNWTDEQVYREVAKDLNTRFGNLGRQGILKSKTAQDTARLLFLAPQWNEGLLRSEAGAITGLAKGAVSSVKEGRPSFGILPRAVGAMLLGQFAANQIINMVTRGKPTWENEEEGVGTKISAWIPDLAGKGPGFFLHPAGLAAEVTHLLTTKYAKKDDFREALMAFMGGRWSTLARPAVTFLTRRDIFQRLIRPENIWKETAKAGIPFPIGASSAVPAIGGAITGESKEPYPGAYQRQMMSSAGIKTDLAESPGQRMVALAQNWKKSQGIKSPGEFYESAYAPLRNAIRRGALKEGREAYDELLKTKTPKQIDAAMKPWTGGEVNRQTLNFSPARPKPLTGSAKHEHEFFLTLSSSQKQIYTQARTEHARQYQVFQNMLRSTKPTAEPSGPWDEFGGVPAE